MNTHFRAARGFTLIEMLLVVTAAMVLIGIGLGIYRNVQSSNGALAAQTGVLQLSASIRSVYPKSDFTGLNAATLVQSGTVPLGMIGAGNVLVNAWGGAITLTPVTVGLGATNNAYEIGLPNVPREACNKLLPAVQDTFSAIRVAGHGGGSGAEKGGSSAPNDLPGPGPTTTIVKDENESPPVAYVTATAVSACNHSKNLITLTGS